MTDHEGAEMTDVAGLVAPEAGLEYGEVHRQLIYDARAVLGSMGGED